MLSLPRSAVSILVHLAVAGLLSGCGDTSEAGSPHIDTVAGRVAAAQQRFEAHGDADHAPVAPRVTQSVKVLGEGAEKRAFHLLRRELEADPSNGEAHFRTGLIFFRRANFGAARPHFEQALETGPSFEENDEAFYWYGLCLRRLGDSDGAEVALRAFVERRPQDGRGYRFLGLILLERGDEAGALSYLNESLAAFAVPGRRQIADLAGVYEALGGLHLQRAELEKAEAAYTQCLRLLPNRYENHYKLARVRSQRGDVEGAKRAMAAFERSKAASGY